MIKLQDEEFIKLSEITGVEYHDIQKLYAMRLLDEDAALGYVMRKDFQKLKKTGKYQTKHIIARISNLYCVSESRVKSAIYSRYNRKCYCDKCRKEITKAMYNRNDGLCDKCKADLIEIY